MIDSRRLEELAYQILTAIGEDPAREGLAETPRRWANWWKEFIDYDPGKLDTAFEIEGGGSNIVCVSGIRVWTLCEHHLLPFTCEIAVGYIPNGLALGLSKFARVAHKHAHRLQIQERLTRDIADEITNLTTSEDVAVAIKGEHLCGTMRGIKTQMTMKTVDLRGAFELTAHRSEFLRLAGW